MFTYWLLAFTQNFQPPHCPVLVSLTRTIQRRKRQMRNLLLVLPTPILKLGVFLYLRVLGATQFLTVRFRYYSKLSAAKTDTTGLEPTTFWLTARRSTNWTTYPCRSAHPVRSILRQCVFRFRSNCYTMGEALGSSHRTNFLMSFCARTTPQNAATPNGIYRNVVEEPWRYQSTTSVNVSMKQNRPSPYTITSS